MYVIIFPSTFNCTNTRIQTISFHCTKSFLRVYFFRSVHGACSSTAVSCCFRSPIVEGTVGNDVEKCFLFALLYMELKSLQMAEYKDKPYEQLSDETLQVAAPVPTSEENDLFCWPWTGIVVNIVKEPDSEEELENTEYWMKRFLKFKPEAVELLRDDKKQSLQALVRFNNDWIGLKNAMEFEKFFEAVHHSKKEWNAFENQKGSSIYAWLARASDFESKGPIGDYLRTNRELKTIADLDQEAMKTRNKAVVELVSEVNMQNENLDDLQIKYNQRPMSLTGMFEEKDSLQQAFIEVIEPDAGFEPLTSWIENDSLQQAFIKEGRKQQQLSREHFKRVLAERELLTADLEKRRKTLDAWIKEPNKKVALTESEKQALNEEKQMDDLPNSYLHKVSFEQKQAVECLLRLVEEHKNDMQNISLHKASIDQKKADECVLRLLEEQDREKDELLKNLLDLERPLDAKQKLELEIQKLKGELQVMKHMGGDRAVEEQIKKVNGELEMKEMNVVEKMNQTLAVKELQSNDELQVDQKELIKNDLQNSSLHLASLEQKKADEIFLRLVEEHKREKEEALKKVAELERQLDAKQKLEMEFEELKGKLQVMKHLGDEDDTAVQEQIKKMSGELEVKMEEMDGVEEMNQTLVVKERQSNDELQEARKELIKNDMHKASIDQKKSDECVLRLFEEQDEGTRWRFLKSVDPPMRPHALDITSGRLMSENKLACEIQKLRAQIKMKDTLICPLIESYEGYHSSAISITMTNTRNQEVDKAIQDNVKAIFDIQTTLGVSGASGETSFGASAQANGDVYTLHVVAKKAASMSKAGAHSLKSFDRLKGYLRQHVAAAGTMNDQLQHGLMAVRTADDQLGHRLAVVFAC
ncbi:hypothetical protein QVD17_34881 [Tagetes erecta]|uniref:XS domain-containing protein n=1 Tax=Tagetes erecta TaxID=13708 RepID=A0AAD8K027_TARER|nr:hypothetical protein QVD17_34881 [Tagetes erecta]